MRMSRNMLQVKPRPKLATYCNDRDRSDHVAYNVIPRSERTGVSWGRTFSYSTKNCLP